MSWLELPARPGRLGLAVGVLAAIASGACWTLAAPPHDLWPLGWVAALPLAWVIDRAPTARRAGLWGGLAALAFTVGGFYWMIYLLQVNAHLATPLAVLGLFLLGGYHGLVFLIGARLTRALRDRRRAHPRGPWPMALCLPLGYVVVEIVVPTPFPFSLALTQAEVGPIRALAAFAGTAGIVALITGLGGAVYDAVTRTSRRWYPLAGVAVFALVAIAGSHRTGGGGAARTIKIGIVQPNDPVGVRHSWKDRVEHLHALQLASRQLEEAGADLVVWSETAYPFAVPRELEGDADRDNPLSLRGDTTGPLLIGAITTVERPGRVDSWNSAILIAPDGRFLGRTDKIHRMVGSEYNPLVEHFPSLEKYMPDGAGHYEGGTEPHILELDVRGQRVRIAVMVCLEDVVPSYGRELAGYDPDLIVNITNDTWFDVHAEPLEHEALARFRAVEVGVPMIRAVNTGPSSHIDAEGAVIARTPVRREGRPETLLATVVLRDRAHSLYAAIGGPLTWLVALGALGWWLVPAAIARVRRRSSEDEPPVAAAAPPKPKAKGARRQRG